MEEETKQSPAHDHEEEECKDVHAPLKIMSDGTETFKTLWQQGQQPLRGDSGGRRPSSSNVRNSRRASHMRRGSLLAAPRIHILDRADLDERALATGTLKMHVANTGAFALRNTLVWRDRFVFMDRTLGLLVFPTKICYEKRDKKTLQILFYRDIAKVTRSNDDEFTLLIKRRAQLKVGRQTIDFICPLGAEQCEDFYEMITEKIQIVATVFTVGANGEFPENAHECQAKPNVGVCFSGGGGRAHVCASSQMRALHYLGLLDKTKTDYLTGVSAGAWATSIYTFYEDSAANDDELFGPLLSVVGNGQSAEALANWSMQELYEQTICPILQPCRESAVTVARELMFSVNARQLWERVLGRIFLRPFGLDEPHPYCLREDLHEIKSRNPQLESVKFFTPRTAQRPFWMCHGSIIGPTWAKLGDILPIQFTPLYVGSPYLHKIHYSSAGGDRTKTLRRRRSSLLNPAKVAEVWVGGGMVSPFVFGCDEPHSLLKDSKPAAPASSSSSLLSAFRTKRTPPPPSTPQPEPEEQKTEMTSLIFASLMKEVTKQETPAAAKSLADKLHLTRLAGPPGTIHRAISDVSDAVDSLQLAPNMIDRVFKYAQAALHTTHHNRRQRPRSKSVHGEGVYSKQVGLPFPEKPFSLRHTVGISSDAPSVNLHERTFFNRLNVQENYWSPVYSHNDGPTQPDMIQVEENELDVTRQIAMDMGDGGSLDNLGICALLQRRVRRIVCFNNSAVCVPAPRHDGNDAALLRHTQHVATVRKLNPEERAGVEDLDRAPTYREWGDDDLLPLFGQEITDSALTYLGTHHEHNHVFPLTELRPLLREFQSKLRQGEPIVVKFKHQVLENSYWGIEGGWEVEVLWVYLDESRVFRESLPQDTQQEMNKMAAGEFARFPNFKTFGNNSTMSFDIALSPRQINLLSIFTEWQVMHNRDLFIEFMDSANMPPLERRRRARDTTVNQLEKEGFA